MVIKCKMCGEDLTVRQGEAVAECQHCKSVQTAPAEDNEKMLGLFSRANRLRLACEFDKAAGVYEAIAEEFATEPEAYWGILLCRYGIEYIDDASGLKKPVCNRASEKSVMEDENLELACENADTVARRMYREEAKAFEELRREVIEKSEKAEKYDVFICCKGTAEDGAGTPDIEIAQDVCNALAERGYRVFLPNTALEGKQKQDFEPYIYAAIKSAKVMLAFGTDYEYYNAPWVKNQWSRFLKLITDGAEKTLIPCYKNIDSYDIPKEFSALKPQDMGEDGAVGALVAEVEKILSDNGKAKTQEVNNIPAYAAVLKEGFVSVAGGKWDAASAAFARVLEMNPRCAQAYFGRLLAKMNIKDEKPLIASGENLFRIDDFRQACIYADSKFKVKLAQIVYESGMLAFEKKQFDKAKEIFSGLGGFKDAKQKAAECDAEKSELNDKILKHTYLKNIIPAGNSHTVGIKADGTVLIAGWNRLGQCNVDDWEDIIEVDAGSSHTVGLRADGTVVAAGYNKDGQCEVSDWYDIISVKAGSTHTVGLRADGTVAAVGDNKLGQCNVSEWTDIIEIAAGSAHTVGLKKDGTAVATGSDTFGQCGVSDWSGVAKVMADRNRTVGLKSDGTVVAAGDNKLGQCNVSDWKNIIALDAGGNRTAGLKADGTVVCAGANDFGQCNVSDWKGVIAVFTRESYTVGLMSDGTVITVGDNNLGQCDVSGWKDIIALNAGASHTIGLKSDGTVVAVGYNRHGQCDVSGWRLFDGNINIDDEIKERKRLAEEKRVNKTKEIEDAKRKAEEEERLAEEKRKAEEEARLAEEKRKAEEERLAEENHTVEEEKSVPEENAGSTEEQTDKTAEEKDDGVTDEKSAPDTDGEPNAEQSEDAADEKSEPENAEKEDSVPITEEERERREAIARLKNEKQRTEKRLVEFEKQLAGLHGLFNGKKRATLEKQIVNVKETMHRIEMELKQMGITE